MVIQEHLFFILSCYHLSRAELRKSIEIDFIIYKDEILVGKSASA